MTAMKYARAIIATLIGALLLVTFFLRPEQAGLEQPEADGLPQAAGVEQGAAESSFPERDNTEPLPTASPTLAQQPPAAAEVEAGSAAEGNPTATPEAFFASDLPTPVGDYVPSQADSTTIDGWNPPPLEVPIAHHQYDHFWLIRPVGPDYNNFGLAHYAYGSDGPANDLRVHHGIDLANPIGVEVFAAGPGRVIWASKGHFNEFESITSYGNTVVIKHDFGYNGDDIYTLYAHLSAILVRAGERVESGQIIGLIGNTGQVTGPHVHFEVRIGRNSYFAVRNPVLWMAPYVNTGVIAGRIVLKDGQLAMDAPINLIDLDTGQVVSRTTTYAGFGVNPDDHWQETFTLPDVPQGRYLVTARYNGSAWSGKVEVIPGTTNWVELENGAPADTETDS